MSELSIEVEYITNALDTLRLFSYWVTISKDLIGKYVISYEKLATKKATSSMDTMMLIFEVVNGEIRYIDGMKDNEVSQLCFTTHNVGPMDVLRQHKKSIDFLSVDHKIYSWKTNGFTINFCS